MAASPTAKRRPRSSRSKRDDIIYAAIEYFGQQGYEYTKWADIAKEVGIGSTALYHYFESKLHCLYEIQADALQADREKFERDHAEHDDFAEALKAVLDAAFELTDHEVLRNRVLVAEQSLAGMHRTSAREEEARQLARSRMRDLEFAWATFLTRGMEQGAIPRGRPAPADPRRARPATTASGTGTARAAAASRSTEVSDFFVARCLAVAGLPAEAPRGPASPREAQARRRSGKS